MAKIEYLYKKFRDCDLDLIQRCNGIMEDYARQGYDLSLRQLYYQLVKANIVPNQDSQYNRLGNLVTDARMCGLIDWGHLQDRHREFNGHYFNDADPAGLIRTLPYHLSLDKWQGQDYHVEVWVEKDALEQVVSRAARQMSVGHMACKGYLSASMMHDAGMRFVDVINNGRKPVVIYLGDHDPSGLNMPEVICDRMETFIGHHTGQSDDFQMEHIALTRSQIRQYNPPPNPAKMTDTRAKKYLAAHGDSSWELDALTPSQMHKLIVEAVRSYRDEDTYQEVLVEQSKKRAVLQGMADGFAEFEKGLSLEGLAANERFIEFGNTVREAVSKAGA